MFWITSLHDRPSIALSRRRESAAHGRTIVLGRAVREVGRPTGVMTIPVIARIGVLVLATTAFYGYVGQMVPQSEVQPPEEIVIRPT